MTVLREWACEWKDIEDPVSGVHIKQLTDDMGNSHHLYFTNPGWHADNTRMLFGSDRENRTNLFSIDLHIGEIVQLTDLDPLEDPYEVGFLKTCVNPCKEEAYFFYGQHVMALDLETGELNAIGEMDEGYRFSMINCTADGKYVCAGEFEDLSDRIDINYSRGYVGFDKTHDAHPNSRIVRIATDGSNSECVWEEDYWIGHVNTSPTQPGLVTFCHEGPWKNVDNRIWGLDLETGDVWKIRERKDNEAVGHEYWYADGVHLGYHGRYPDKHAIFGKVRFDNTENEETPCKSETGHTHSNDDSLIVGDGGKEIRLWKKTEGTYRGPRTLCEHRSSFKVQKVHAHPRFTPDSQQVVFTSDWTGYGNVYMADVADFESLPEIE